MKLKDFNVGVEKLLRLWNAIGRSLSQDADWKVAGFNVQLLFCA